MPTTTEETVIRIRARALGYDDADTASPTYLRRELAAYDALLIGNKITTAMQADDHAAALQLMDAYRECCEAMGLEELDVLPPQHLALPLLRLPGARHSEVLYWYPTWTPICARSSRATVHFSPHPAPPTALPEPVLQLPAVDGRGHIWMTIQTTPRLPQR